MKYLIVGTAGHVDHGKTALIKRITGVDTDRLQEEKLRGISIDLGFAALQLGEVILGIVDVPGHEKFLKNMLAGTGGVDVAMLVVAADEGVMPQTREHLEMLCYFGIRAGIVVLTKVDKVEAEWLSLVEDEVRKLAEGTFLADAPIVSVSALTGQGIDKMLETLREICEKAASRDSEAPFHLWVDRTFHVKGYGLVATGSLLGGMISAGDTASLYPQGVTVKIRGVETHGKKLEKIIGGQRAALNLTGIAIEDIGRGQLLAATGSVCVSRHWEGVLCWKTKLPSGTRVRFHLGTGEFIGRISYRKSPSEERQVVRFHAEKLLPAGSGDQGILRRYSPQDLVGSLTLVTPAKGKTKWGSAEILKAVVALETKNWAEWMWLQLSGAGGVITLDEWVRVSGFFSRTKLLAAVGRLEKDKKVTRMGEYYILPRKKQGTLQLIRMTLQKFHVEQPDKNGLSREVLRQIADVPEKILEVLLKQLEQEKVLESRGDLLALIEHVSDFSARNEEWVQLLEKISTETNDLEISVETLSTKSGKSLSESQRAFERLVRDGQLVRLGGIHVYSKTIQYIVKLIQEHFHKQETLSVGELRDLLQTTRKTAVPLMEYLDANKYTYRTGDVRTPGSKLLNSSFAVRNP